MTIQRSDKIRQTISKEFIFIFLMSINHAIVQKIKLSTLNPMGIIDQETPSTLTSP
jgi:hypothetical protein